MLITRAEVAGVGPLDVRLAKGRIAEIAPSLARRSGEPWLDAAGGALLPGLHDHHLHLFALARAEASLWCGPPQVRDRSALAAALAGVPAPEGWIRGIGYHESVAGELDREHLDGWVPERPLRLQHRSGAMWMLNSVAVDRLGLDRGVDAAGVERDRQGRATGRLFRLDAWLRERLGSDGWPDLGPVGRRLASFGVTGLTDATASNSAAEIEALTAAVERGELPQRVRVMGSPELPRSAHPGLERGAVKILLDDFDLPPFESLRARIAEGHAQHRAVAIHCVTRTELVLALAAFAAAGARSGDRIEHAAVTPPDVLELLADLPLTVVTQPGFVRERGDAYLLDVAPADQPWLYRGRGFLEAAVPLGGGTDAPFGDPDPWRAMRAAVERRTLEGVELGPGERLTPEQALALFTSPADAPGAPPRSLEPGACADLCLLDRPWARAREPLSSAHVVATIRDGALIWSRGP